MLQTHTVGSTTRNISTRPPTNPPLPTNLVRVVLRSAVSFQRMYLSLTLPVRKHSSSKFRSSASRGAFASHAHTIPRPAPPPPPPPPPREAHPLPLPKRPPPRPRPAIFVYSSYAEGHEVWNGTRVGYVSNFHRSPSDATLHTPLSLRLPTVLNFLGLYVTRTLQYPLFRYGALEAGALKMSGRGSCKSL